MLQGILPEVYLEHFSFLVMAVHILLRESISKDDLQKAQHFLQNFVEGMEKHYGKLKFEKLIFL